MYKIFSRIFILFLIFLFGCFQHTSFAQQQVDPSQLKSMYEDSRFQEILSITTESEDTLSLLYRAKSLYSLDQCSEANRLLQFIKQSSVSEIRQDAYWTSILCLVQLRELTHATYQLFLLEEIFRLPAYRSSSTNLKRDLLRFLTESELLELSRRDLKPDQLLEVYRHGNFSSQVPLASYLQNQLQLSGVDSSVIASVSKSTAVISSRTVPEGFVYRIGVLLPYSEDPEFIESQSAKALYNGLIIAIDELNKRFDRTYVQLRFLNSSMIDDSANTIQETLWMDHPVDVVIGPLYSDRAIELISELQLYQIPVVLPLANSDEIHGFNSSVIQLNPTFSVHGRAMARYAVSTLGYDTLSVITDRNSLGYAAAVAFKDEAEKLGALIPEFYAGDMANTGYDIRPFTNTLFSDSVMIDSLNLTPVEAIYAPFTGAGAQTLIRLLMTDLAAKRNPLPILGLEEWNSDETQSLRLDSAQVYYSSAFRDLSDSIKVQRFHLNYEGRFSEPPSLLAQTGYDTGLFIGGLLLETGNPSSFFRSLHTHLPFSGLRQTYVIRNSINQSVEIHPYFR